MATPYIHTTSSYLIVYTARKRINLRRKPCGALYQDRSRRVKIMAARIVVGLACIMVILRLSEAAVYKVGDSAGWTTIANVDYKLWASTKTFHIGDTVCEFLNFLNNLIIH